MSGPPRRRLLPARLAALAAATLLLRTALAPAGFVAGGRAAPALRGGRALLRAEAEEPKALVKVDEENTAAMASLIGGITGVLVGGPILGLAGFAGAAFLARQGEDNDAATALKGVSSAGIEAVNFVAKADEKYEVTSRVGSALGEQVTKVKDQSPQAAKVIDEVSSAVKAVDKDLSIGGTLSSLVTTGSAAASGVVDKAIETNDKYKITDKIKDTIDDAVSKVQSRGKA